MKNVLLLMCVFFWPILSAAQEITPDIPLQNSVQEQQARTLFYELRCEVCQGQTIADSNSALAADMRALVRNKIAAGESPGAIRQYFAEHYGEDILMRPPITERTFALWFMPSLLLAIGILCYLRYFRTKTAL